MVLCCCRHAYNEPGNRSSTGVSQISARQTNAVITVGAVGISHITKLRDDDIPASKYIFSEEQYHFLSFVCVGFRYLLIIFFLFSVSFDKRMALKYFKRS